MTSDRRPIVLAPYRPHPGVRSTRSQGWRLLKTAIDLRESWWPGPGSNRRPSAFQVGRIAADLRFNSAHASNAAR
jgi:hypothetical protein